MKRLLCKEIRLASSPLSFLFLAFGLMAFIPNYPILVGGFFISLGIFQSFQTSRTNADILYSALLPIAKADVVRAKMIFSAFIEICGFLVAAAATLVRMAFLTGAPVYQANALMNPNFVFLGYLLLIFGLFNLIFVAGFFKTAYYFTKPFVAFLIAAFLVIGVAEALPHFPSLGALNTPDFSKLPLQFAFLAGGVLSFALLTVLATKLAIRRFERIDL